MLRFFILRLFVLSMVLFSCNNIPELKTETVPTKIDLTYETGIPLNEPVLFTAKIIPEKVLAIRGVAGIVDFSVKDSAGNVVNQKCENVAVKNDIAQCRFIFPNELSYTVTADYKGDEELYDPSTISVDYAVNKVGVKLEFSTLPESVLTKQTFNFNVTISRVDGKEMSNPRGAVEVSVQEGSQLVPSNSQPICTALAIENNSKSYKCTYIVSDKPDFNSITISARFAADDLYGSGSAEETIRVNRPVPLALTLSEIPEKINTTVPVEITVTVAEKTVLFKNKKLKGSGISVFPGKIKFVITPIINGTPGEENSRMSNSCGFDYIQIKDNKLSCNIRFQSEGSYSVCAEYGITDPAFVGPEEKICDIYNIGKTNVNIKILDVPLQNPGNIYDPSKGNIDVGKEIIIQAQLLKWDKSPFIGTDIQPTGTVTITEDNAEPSYAVKDSGSCSASGRSDLIYTCSYKAKKVTQNGEKFSLVVKFEGDHIYGSQSSTPISIVVNPIYAQLDFEPVTTVAAANQLKLTANLTNSDPGFLNINGTLGIYRGNTPQEREPLPLTDIYGSQCTTPIDGFSQSYTLNCIYNVLTQFGENIHFYAVYTPSSTPPVNDTFIETVKTQDYTVPKQLPRIHFTITPPVDEISYGSRYILSAYIDPLLTLPENAVEGTLFFQGRVGTSWKSIFDEGVYYNNNPPNKNPPVCQYNNSLPRIFECSYSAGNIEDDHSLRAIYIPYYKDKGGNIATNPYYEEICSLALPEGIYANYRGNYHNALFALGIPHTPQELDEMIATYDCTNVINGLFEPKNHVNFFASLFQSIKNKFQKRNVNLIE